MKRNDVFHPSVADVVVFDKKEHIKRLEQDKKNIIAQLVDYEELKSENGLLRELLTARQI
jgi:hypothetical protein